MKTLVKTFFAMLLICVVSTQMVSAQEKGPYTDTKEWKNLSMAIKGWEPVRLICAVW